MGCIVLTVALLCCAAASLLLRFRLQRLNRKSDRETGLEGSRVHGEVISICFVMKPTYAESVEGVGICKNYPSSVTVKVPVFGFAMSSRDYMLILVTSTKRSWMQWCSRICSADIVRR